MFGTHFPLRLLRQRLNSESLWSSSRRRLFRNASRSTAAENTSRDGKRPWPCTCDVLVVGGGAVGSSAAYHLKERAQDDLSVVVVEQDSTYKRASTVLSLGNIREQFSVAENVQLSMYGREFLRRAPELLAVEGVDPPDPQFVPRGYLFLALEDGLKQMQENYKLQTSLGAKVEWLWPRQLEKRFPWIRIGNVAAAVIGSNSTEGWFDPWILLLGLRRKAESLGAQYLAGQVTGLTHQEEPAASEAASRTLTSAQITLANGETREVSFSTLVVAAGAWSGALGRMAGLGSGPGLMATPIPVEPR